MVWVDKANLRGAPGYSATGAAEDDAAIAAFLKQTAGPSQSGQAVLGIAGAEAARVAGQQVEQVRGESAVRYARRYQTAPGLVVFTWDDSTIDHWTHVHDEASKRGQAHSFAVISSKVGTPGYLSAAQVKALSDYGHEIQSHSVTHQNIGAMSAADSLKELVDSQTALQAITGKPVRSMVWPYGGRSATSRSQCVGLYDNVHEFNNSPLNWRPTSRNNPDTYHVNRYSWSFETHQAILSAIRIAASQPVIVVIAAHLVSDVANGVALTITRAQLQEALNLVESLGIQTATASGALGTSNKLLNPVFMDGQQQWTTFSSNAEATATVVNEQIPDFYGKPMRLINNGNNVSVYQRVSVDPRDIGTLWRWSGKFKTDATAQLRFSMKCFNANGVAVPNGDTVSPQSSATTDAYSQFNKGITIPQGTMYMELTAELLNNTGTAYFGHNFLAPETYGVLG